MKTVRVGIIGGGWISKTHVEALRTVPEVEITASWSRSPDTLRHFQETFGIPEGSTDWREVVRRKDVDAVCVNTPNFLHAAVMIEAARAGKHIICEKPLCLTIEEGEEVIDAVRRAGVVLGYAEELCFVPRFVKAKGIADQGALGRVYMVKQCEKHAGPYSPWFFKPEEAGGGILMDMGCHGIEFCRFALGKPAVRSVTAHAATFLHGEVTRMDDHVIVLMEMEGGAIALVESSWALKGGMTSIAEFYGTEGFVGADLLKDTGLKVFSEKGYDGGGDETRGWSTPTQDSLWENGYPQEMAHFIGCIRTGREPVESAADGMAVLEIMLAAYESAATGRRVPLPFRPKGVRVPVDLWLDRKGGDGKST